jgi:hypothetical protein
MYSQISTAYGELKMFWGKAGKNHSLNNVVKVKKNNLS